MIKGLVLTPYEKTSSLETCLALERDSLYYIVISDSLMNSFISKIDKKILGLYKNKSNYSNVKITFSEEPPLEAHCVIESDTIINYYIAADKSIRYFKYLSISENFELFFSNLRKDMAFYEVINEITPCKINFDHQIKNKEVIVLGEISVITNEIKASDFYVGGYEILLSFKDNKLKRMVSGDMGLTYHYLKDGKVSSETYIGN